MISPDQSTPPSVPIMSPVVAVVSASRRIFGVG
jgi:hypothetical protein